MLTEKDYCDYDTSRELKELSFIAGLGEDNCGHCLYDDAWHDQVDRPLLYEAQKWLREEHNLHIDVRLHGIIGYQCEVCTSERTITVGREFLTYEEALSEGLRKAIEILKILKEK